MRTRIGMLLLLLVIQGSVPSGRAQDGQEMHVWSGYIPDRAQGPFPPAMTTSRFPLRVQILSEKWKYNGNHEYKGFGNVSMMGSPNQQFSYTYRCVNSFEDSGTAYPARWLKPGRKLEILMGKPKSHRTEACRLSTRS